MTKKEIEIIQNLEFNKYKNFKEVKERYGEDDTLTSLLRCEWSSVYDVMIALHIPFKKGE